MRMIVVGDCVSLKHGTHQSLDAKKHVNSTDRKGIKRGGCEAEGCEDCDGYIYDPLKGSQCQYCGCYPTKHTNLGEGIDDEVGDTLDRREPEIHILDSGCDTMIYEVDDEGNITPVDGNFEKQNRSSPGPSYIPSKKPKLDTSIDKKNARYLPLREIANTMDRLSQETCTFMKKSDISPELSESRIHSLSFDEIVSKLSHEQLYAFCVPSRLPPNVPNMTQADLLFIIRWVAWSMNNLQITLDEDFLEVAKLMLRRYPGLQSALAKEKSEMGLVKALKESLGLLSIGKQKVNFIMPQNCPPKKANPSSITSPEPKSESIHDKVNTKHYETCKLHIQKEMQKSNQSLGMMRSLISSCRKERRILAKEHSYSFLIEELPCLQVPQIVLWEFIQQEALQCTAEDLETRWLKEIPGLMSYFSACLSGITKISEDLATVKILQCLPSYFDVSSEKGKNDRKNHVLEVFGGNILPLYVFPPKGDPPRLFAISGEDMFSVYVEGKSVYKGPIVKALVFLVAVYFVFDLVPWPGADPAFMFVFGILMKEKAKEKYEKYDFVVEALEAVWQYQP